MAVIDGLPEIKVSIRLNGSTEDCGEYNDPEPPQTPASRGPATHYVSKIIESQDDTSFSVHYEVRDAGIWIQGSRCLRIDIYIDGKLVESTALRESNLIDQVVQGTVEGRLEPSAKPGLAILKPFMFTAIKQVEETGARVAEDLEVVKHLGNIEVVIYRAKVQRKAEWRPKAVVLKTELAEKAMKGRNLSHGMRFSEGRDFPKPDVVSCNTIDGEVRLARFIFRYKSKTALQIEGIIPFDPFPESSPEAQPLNTADLPQDELQRLAQERLDQLAKLKQERGTSVKREADNEMNSRPRKIYKTTADGFIDLTE